MRGFILKYKFIIIAIAVFSTLLIGGTYAWINIEIFGNKTNRVAAGTLSIELDESTCENITTTNAYPLSDEDGLKQVACTFSVENTGSLDSVYSVFLDDIEIEADEERMPDASMKYALKRSDGSNIIRTLDSTITDSERLLDSRRIKVGEKNTYELRFWIKEDAGVEAMNKVFYTNLRVVANLDTPKPVIENVNDYYTYSSGLVSLSTNFKTAVNGNTSFTDSKGNVWNPGDPLPNPGRTYIDVDGNEKDVTSMYRMFYSNNTITIDLSSFNNSKVINMREMFAGCSATILDLSSFGTSSVTDMSSMFAYSDATTLDLSGFDTSNVTDMNSMFKKSAANTLDLSSFDTSNVTSMNSMFVDSSATTLDLSSFDTSSVTNMFFMFMGSGATILDLSGFDTSNVTGMSYMFDSISATTLDLSSFDTSNVIAMKGMFAYSDATTLNLSSFDTSSVTDMSRMFQYCDATTLNLSGFDTSSVTDMSEMFYNSKANTLDLSSFDTGNVTDMVSMFSSCNANPIYVKDQAMLDRLVTDGSADSYRLQIK